MKMPMFERSASFNTPSRKIEDNCSDGGNDIPEWPLIPSARAAQVRARDYEDLAFKKLKDRQNSIVLGINTTRSLIYHPNYQQLFDSSMKKKN